MKSFSGETRATSSEKTARNQLNYETNKKASSPNFLTIVPVKVTAEIEVIEVSVFNFVSQSELCFPFAQSLDCRLQIRDSVEIYVCRGRRTRVGVEKLSLDDEERVVPALSGPVCRWYGSALSSEVASRNNRTIRSAQPLLCD